MSLVSLIDENILQPQPADRRFANGPFKHVKNMQPRKKSRIFMESLRSILQKQNFTVKNRVSSEHDFIANGRRISVIGSMEDREKTFSFFQIRPNDDFDVAYFMFFYPNDIGILTMDKKTVQKNCKNGMFSRQHSGMNDEKATYMVKCDEEELMLFGAVKYA